MLESATIGMVSTDQMHNFFTKGYYTGQITNDLNFFNNYEFVDCNYSEKLNIEPEVQRYLNELHSFFSENLIAKVFSSFTIKSNGMWNGVDEGSSKWHNDFEDGDPFNSNILLYLDDNFKSGNYLQVTDQNEVYTIYPKINEFVWLNQAKCFKHRAHHKSGIRRLLSFEFYIDDIR